MEERTEKERREAVEPQLRYNQLLQNMEDIEYQISKLEAERRKYENAQTEYDFLYRQKLQLLTQENGETAREIMELEGHIQRSKSNLREIGEAIDVGNDVLQSLEEAAKSLSSAKDWGVWDIIGGGLVANMIKHSHIDEANKTVQRTQSLLRRFRSELADVRIAEEMRVDISEFAKFADYFFDGLFADLFVQDKIKASLESVHAVHEQVQGVMSRLGDMENAEQSMQEHLNAKIRKLIIEA